MHVHYFFFWGEGGLLKEHWREGCICLCGCWVQTSTIFSPALLTPPLTAQSWTDLCAQKSKAKQANPDVNKQNGKTSVIRANSRLIMQSGHWRNIGRTITDVLHIYIYSLENNVCLGLVMWKSEAWGLLAGIIYVSYSSTTYEQMNKNNNIQCDCLTCYEKKNRVHFIPAVWKWQITYKCCCLPNDHSKVLRGKTRRQRERKKNRVRDGWREGGREHIPESHHKLVHFSPTVKKEKGLLM